MQRIIRIRPHLRKVGTGRRAKYIPVRGHYKRYRSGSGITDYLPSYSGTLSKLGTAASYIPGSSSVANAYNSAKNYGNAAKEAYDVYRDVKTVDDKYDYGDPNQIMVPSYDENGKRIKPAKLKSRFAPLIGKLKSLRPISFIDKALGHFGFRDRVRNALKKSDIGKVLVDSADSAMQLGFGRRRDIRILPMRRKVYHGRGYKYCY